ncbi:ABC-type proline/glycine betaine transport system/ ATPase component [Synechococcus sp. MIT S9220]|uniref:quaternary amine ABC transporter ATP-binding protein n=1 Tax=unclassified Synechococcus TaxID=2626047 RepID=UPI00164B7C27|nr:betaine/proline/choline family ABC transporter ATP-binding protein [Synechococcus sp. MIT S9220]QNJ21709.1 ABC-type proline/glycine betaine transport system/ ATPase component [Synechococcus sp. MIT S9220]
MQSEISIESVWKLFGKSSSELIEQLRSGADPEDLHASRGVRAAVQDVSMQVRAGEIFVVMGLSGSGKSTLLRMLNGLISPCEGEVTVKGRSLNSMTAPQLAELRRHQMAMVFQSFALFPHRNVLENAAFGLEVAGMARKARTDRAMQALERVGLAAEARKRPRELSGGMQQRVGLARALALDPPILLMDEAFSALDPLIRKDMQDLLLDLQAEHRRTVVFISHDLDEAIRIGDRIALMQAGRLLQCDTAQRLLQHPANNEVRRFFRDVDVASVLTVEAIVQPPPRLSVCDVGEPLPDDGVVTMYVTDRLQHFRGLIRPGLGWVDMAAIKTLSIGTSVKAAIDVVATSSEPVPVLDDEQRLLGVISARQLLLAMEAGG